MNALRGAHRAGRRPAGCPVTHVHRSLQTNTELKHRVKTLLQGCKKRKTEEPEMIVTQNLCLKIGSEAQMGDSRHE